MKLPRPADRKTWYETTRVAGPERPVLDYAAECDVCIVGAGLAGLTLARELARRGWDVVVLEAETIGSGASGRNGGFVLHGFALDLASIEARIGLDHAKALHALSVAGMEYIRSAVEDLRMPGVMLTPGALRVLRHPGGVDGFRLNAERMAKVYGHPLLFWPQSEIRSVLRTDAYQAGLYDSRGFHIHPLNYCVGLAADALRAGARIYEQSPAVKLDLRSIRRLVRTPRGVVRCNRIVFCTAASMRTSVHRRVAGAVVPVSTYVAVTEALGDRLNEAVRFSGGVLDTRRAGNYFRRLPGGRLMWGTGITTRRSLPARLDAMMLRDMASVFPSLSEVKIEHAWSGVMAYARHKMPQIAEVGQDVWVASAFGGHGLNTTAMAGLLLARAFADGDRTYRLFEPFDVSPTFGPIGRIVAQLEYWRLRTRDRVDELRSA